MQRKRSGLGRGLDALIPAGEKKPEQSGILQVDIQKIKPNPHQPRKQFLVEELAELAASIREHGIIQPLVVSPSQDLETFVLIAGERRLQAAHLAGLKQVPVITRDASEQQYLELALIENIQRTDLNPLEAAEAYRQLADDFGLSHDEIAERVGKSRTAITNTLRLLRLPENIQNSILSGQITEGHARALLALPSPQSQSAVLQMILQGSLNVRQTEDLVRKYTGKKPTNTAKPVLAPEFKQIEDRLRSHLGTRVRLSHGERGGSITIHFYSDEELDGILSRIIGESFASG